MENSVLGWLGRIIKLRLLLLFQCLDC